MMIRIYLVNSKSDLYIGFQKFNSRNMGIWPMQPANIKVIANHLSLTFNICSKRMQ